MRAVRSVKDGEDALGVYVSVPFCRAKCSFCNFASGVFAGGEMEAYVGRLCAEMRGGEGRAAERWGRSCRRWWIRCIWGRDAALAGSRSSCGRVFAALRGEFASGGGGGDHGGVRAGADCG